MKRYLQSIFGVVTGLLLVAGAGPSDAKDLVIGTQMKFTTNDPHFDYNLANNALSPHVFDPLLAFDEEMQLVPRLAVSWKALDDTTWEFKLRQGVRWHDGSPFTAADVAFTLDRARNVPGSVKGYGEYIKPVKATVVVDDHTIHLKTAEAFPLLPIFMSQFTIVSRKTGEKATTDDYNSGKAAIGTGPYRFVRWQQNSVVELVRNPDYWGGAQPWEKVALKTISSGPSRVAALLAGDVDMIDFVPGVDLPRLRKDPKITVFSHASHQITFLALDFVNDDSPFIRAKDGKPLGKNPLRDLRVRRALSMAIDRQALVDRIMDGLALPASQLVPPGFGGYSRALLVERYDPERARALLAQAGYKDGFALTIHGPNDRYPNDAQITEAIGQMLARIGLDVKVQTRPAAVHFTEATKKKLSVWLQAAGNFTGEASRTVNAILASFDKEKGSGSLNRGGYFNPLVDLGLHTALATVDDAKRNALLARAQDAAIGDLAVIPLYHPSTAWATRKGVAYSSHYTADTYAMRVKPAP